MLTFQVTLTATGPNGQTDTVELAVLRKDAERLGDLGLTLAESKGLLAALQREVVQRQAGAHAEARRCCPDCGRRRRKKGSYPAVFRTLFGNVRLASPRLYHCPCAPRVAKTFSPLRSLLTEHAAPELLYLETKWASLAPYAKVADLLKDVLPVAETTNAATVRNHLHRVALRDEAALGEEQVMFARGCPADWAALPRPDGPLTVGIDGAYVRDWGQKKTHFGVVVGKSVPRDGPPRRFAFAQGHDEKPKRRLFELLREQGLQMNQRVDFFSDGGDDVRQLQLYLAPFSRHYLDWFHVAMRLTVLGQYAKGLARVEPQLGVDVQRLLASLKWYLWHGNVYEALLAIRDIEMDVYEAEETYPKFKALERAVREFHTYLENNGGHIPNYGERYRNGEPISTGFVESAVNQVVSKRFAKRQQMQWTRPGAHLLLQMRTRVLDGELAP
ncbi:MAG: ISKra4 family transposase, partial [Bacteroidota bacterium]